MDKSLEITGRSASTGSVSMELTRLSISVTAASTFEFVTISIVMTQAPSTARVLMRFTSGVPSILSSMRKQIDSSISSGEAPVYSTETRIMSVTMAGNSSWRIVGNVSTPPITNTPINKFAAIGL